MALSARQRKSIPSSKFGLPGRAKTAKGKAKPGSFPMQDRTHQIAAERLAPKSEKAGNISHAQEQQIVSKAKRLLGSSSRSTSTKGKTSGKRRSSKG